MDFSLHLALTKEYCKLSVCAFNTLDQEVPDMWGHFQNCDVSTMLLLMHLSKSEWCDLKITSDERNFQAFFSETEVPIKTKKKERKKELKKKRKKRIIL